jgi:flagellar protein FlaG
MNDVNVINQDFALKQGVSSSSVTPASEQELSERKVNSSEAEQAEVNQTRESEGIESAVTRLNDYVQTVQRDLQFKLDDDSGKTIITVVDRNTDEVVRQIPDDVAIRLAQDLQQEEPISLFNAKV